KLRLETDLVDLLQLARKLPRGERARAVRAVAVDDAARVDDDELARLEHLVARSCVRACAVRPGGDDDGKGEALGPALAEQLLHPPGKLALAPADGALLGE